MASSPTPPAPAPPRRRPGGEPRRRRTLPVRPATPLRTRLLKWVFVFIGVVLLVDGLVGERGFLETRRARAQAQAQAARLEALRAENASLRESMRLLKEDPATIEAEARRQLGLIKPGELLFIVKDVRPAAGAPNGH